MTENSGEIRARPSAIPAAHGSSTPRHHHAIASGAEALRRAPGHANADVTTADARILSNGDLVDRRDVHSGGRRRLGAAERRDRAQKLRRFMPALARDVQRIGRQAGVEFAVMVHAIPSSSLRTQGQPCVQAALRRT